MGNVEIGHHRKVLGILKRRLQQRELQAATYGISADPSINIEIEDLRKEIRSLEWEITRLSEDRIEARSTHLAGLSESISEPEDGISNVKFDLNGEWKLEEIYEFGSTTGDVHIQQYGSHLSGVMTIQDSMDDGEVVTIQEHFSGTIRETTVFLYGEYISTIGGMADDYELDQWIGIIKDSNTIEGNSEDIVATKGRFVMKRIS